MDDANIFGTSEKDQFQKKVFICTFSMIAKLTDIDGSVDRTEVLAVDRFMKSVLNLDNVRRQFAIKVFNEARKAPANFRDYALQYKELLEGQPRMLEWLIDVLLRVSMADDVFSQQEERLLRTACEVFGINEQRYQQLRSRHVKGQPNLNYEVLGCTPQSTNEELAAAYEKMRTEYNPQRVKEFGLPEEFVKLAEEKYKAIEDAYQAIKKARSG